MLNFSAPPERTDTTRREQLLKGALELFAERGYAGASVKAIAERAGVSQGLLYVHFDNKEALLRALFEREMEDVQGTLDASAAATSADSVGTDTTGTETSRPTTGLEALEVLLRAAFGVVTDNRDLWQLSYALRFQPAVWGLLEPSLSVWTASVRGQLEGVCRKMKLAQPELEARLLFATIDGACQHAVLEPDYPVEDVIGILLDRYRLAGRAA